MDTDHGERIARNEARFREMNERIRHAVASRLEPDGEAPFPVMCECAVTECTDMIEVTFEEYGRARETATRFLIRPEHMIAPYEEPIERTERYWIVRKLGEGRRIAEELA